MNWDFVIKLVGDAAIIIATFCGPIYAVRTQRKLDDLKSIRATQQQVFSILMAHRATFLAPARVEALNSIPIVFYGSADSLVAINQAWRDLLYLFDHASDLGWQGQEKVRDEKRLELDTALLRAVGSHLGYEFPSLDIKTQHYFPTGLGNRIGDEEAIRQGMAAILSGKAALRVQDASR